jgi:hypothetical protein
VKQLPRRLPRCYAILHQCRPATAPWQHRYVCEAWDRIAKGHLACDVVPSGVGGYYGGERLATM